MHLAASSWLNIEIIAQKHKVDHLIIKFDSMLAGVKQRKDHPVEAGPFTSENGTPLFRHNCLYNITGSKGRKHQARANVFQFPIRLAWAMTCHKMQVKFNVNLNQRIIECYWNYNIQF